MTDQDIQKELSRIRAIVDLVKRKATRLEERLAGAISIAPKKSPGIGAKHLHGLKKRRTEILRNRHKKSAL